MSFAAGLFLLASIALLIRQLRWTRRFSAAFTRQPRSVADSALPRAAVILSLRGADPSLGKCLTGLLGQDYPRYEVRIILDGPNDPAAEIVHGVLKRSGATSVTVSVLRDHQLTCSLKSSAILQTIAELDESVDAIAIVDADAVVYPNWLRDLVSPLLDPAVGAANGLRWFSPLVPHAGALVRKLWGIAAGVQMHAFQVSWGGSLAIRRDVFRNPRVLDRWLHHPTEDASLYDALRELDLKAELVPAATILNCETADLLGSFRFIRRQLLWLWLSHSAAICVVREALLSAGIFWLAPAVTLVALANGDRWPAGIAALAWLIHQAGQAAIVLRSNSCPRRVARLRGETLRRSGLTPWTLLMGLVTQVVYQAAVLSMLCLRQIEWRGILYRFNSSGQFRMIEYRPYVQEVFSRSAPHASL